MNLPQNGSMTLFSSDLDMNPEKLDLDPDKPDQGSPQDPGPGSRARIQGQDPGPPSRARIQGQDPGPGSRALLRLSNPVQALLKAMTFTIFQLAV